MIDMEIIDLSLRARGLRLAMLAMALTFAMPQVRAINIKLDYTFDTNNFFAASNPNGPAAKAALEAVATFYSGILEDTFSSIQTPPNFSSAQSGGVATWNWSMLFTHPGTGGDVTLQNQVIAADDYRVYAGGRPISGSTLGIGGTGGGGWGRGGGGLFSQAELNQIYAIDAAFAADVENREEPTSEFAGWGGSITFDSVGTVWHFDHTTPPVAGTNDFFSVAVHELGHALGFGASTEWNTRVSDGEFVGPAAFAEYGSDPPVSGGHWASGTMSRIYGTNTPQEAAMDPQITEGTRKRLTALDAAALTDIGWEVAAALPPTFNPADFNEDTFVNGADLTLWRSAFGLTATGDADNDGDSDGRDFLIWQRNLGAPSLTPTSIASSSAVPEPSAALMAVLSGAALLWLASVRPPFRCGFPGS